MALIAHPHAVLAEALHLRKGEQSLREHTIRESRAAADEGGSSREDQLVEQVGVEQLAGEVAAADKPGARVASGADPADELGEVARVRLDDRVLERGQLLGVRDDRVGLPAYGQEPCATMKSQVALP